MHMSAVAVHCKIGLVVWTTEWFTLVADKLRKQWFWVYVGIRANYISNLKRSLSQMFSGYMHYLQDYGWLPFVTIWWKALILEFAFTKWCTIAKKLNQLSARHYKTPQPLGKCMLHLAGCYKVLFSRACISPVSFFPIDTMWHSTE